MAGKDSKQLKKSKKKSKKDKTEIVVASPDDLREIVTETVTKLLAEDVLEMDDSGKIDVKQPEILQKNQDKKSKSKKKDKKGK